MRIGGRGVQNDAARVKLAECVESARHADVETCLDVADGVGRDPVRDIVGRALDPDPVAHVEEPLTRVLREESAGVGRTTGSCGLLETCPLPLERSHVRGAPLFLTATETRREEFTDQSAPLWCEVVVVVDEHAALVDEQDIDRAHERDSAT